MVGSKGTHLLKQESWRSTWLQLTPVPIAGKEDTNTQNVGFISSSPFSLHECVFWKRPNLSFTTKNVLPNSF